MAGICENETETTETLVNLNVLCHNNLGASVITAFRIREEFKRNSVFENDNFQRKERKDYD